MAGIEARRGLDRIVLTRSKPSCHPRRKSSMTKLKWVASKHCSASSTDVVNVTRQSWSQDFKHSWTISLSAGRRVLTRASTGLVPTLGGDVESLRTSYSYLAGLRF